MKARLLWQIHEIFKLYTGLPDSQIIATVAETPATDIIENGHVMSDTQASEWESTAPA